MNKKKLCPLILFLILIGVWNLSYGNSHNTSLRHISLALTGPLSGGSSAMGISMCNGAKLAIKEVNDQGGLEINGEKYVINALEFDDEGKNERGALMAQKISQMPSLHAVIGTANTGVALAGDDHYQEAKIVRILTPASGTAAMAQWTEKNTQNLYIFRFAANDLIQVTMLLDEAIQKMGFKKLALIHDATDYGTSGRNDILEQLKNYPGVELVDIERFNIGDENMTEQIRKIKDSKAQALLVWGIGPEAAAIANEMHRIGLQIPLLGSWTLSMASYLDNAGRHAEGTLMPLTFLESDKFKKAGDFITGYYDAYKVKSIPSPMSAAQGYDAVKILFAAFQQAKTLTSEDIKDALENLEKPVSGVIANWVKPYAKWDPKNPLTHEAFHAQEVVMATVKDGKIVLAHDQGRG